MSNPCPSNNTFVPNDLAGAILSAVPVLAPVWLRFVPSGGPASPGRFAGG